MKTLLHLFIALIVGFEAYAFLISRDFTLMGIGILLLPVALVATVIGKKKVHYSFDHKKPEEMSKTDLFLQNSILGNKSDRKKMLLNIPFVIALFLIATHNDVFVYTGFALVVLSAVTAVVIDYIYEYQSIKYEAQLYKHVWHVIIRRNEPEYESPAILLRKLLTTSLFFDLFVRIVVLLGVFYYFVYKK